MNIKKILVGSAAGALMLGAMIVPAFADSVGPINFESPYTIGNIDGQQGWMKTGAYDVEVANVSAFPNALTFGFQTQALRLDNAVTSGSFGDQTFSPGLTSPAGESLANNHFEASFDIGSTLDTVQPGLFLSVSPDDGTGGRMSYAGFQDELDGIHVIFYDATDPGPLGTVASFNSTDVATINRTSAHSIKFSIDYVSGPANDVVKLYVDNVLVHTGTTWEDYYRYDPEQLGNGNVVPTTSKLIFREGGTAAEGTSGNGYLVDNVSLSSGPIPATGKALGSVTGGLNLTGPRQQISFNAFDYGNSSLDTGNVEYQNFEYPGGLHYTANVLCANVKQATNQAWFMFQIPTGFPGLSGLYVVSYVKDGGTPGTKGDLYGHAATGDLATAKSWCESGTVGAGYTVTGGNAVVHK